MQKFASYKNSDQCQRVQVRDKMLKISIDGFSAAGQTGVQKMLLQLVMDRHAWGVEEDLSTACVYRLRFEFALFDIVEVYGALQRTGIQFTPEAHRALTQVCVCEKYFADSTEVKMVTVDLQVTSREELRVHFQNFARSHSV
jgi:hypothetical protein